MTSGPLVDGSVLIASVLINVQSSAMCKALRDGEEKKKKNRNEIEENWCEFVGVRMSMSIKLWEWEKRLRMGMSKCTVFISSIKTNFCQR